VTLVGETDFQLRKLNFADIILMSRRGKRLKTLQRNFRIAVGRPKASPARMLDSPHADGHLAPV
jgi:hypothetical protein